MDHHYPPEVDINTISGLSLSKRESLIIAATKAYNVPLVKMLLENGVSVNACDSARKTPLHYAIHAVREHKSPQLIDLLLTHGADVNFVSCNGDTPVFYAIDILSRLDFKLFTKAMSYCKDINFASRSVSERLQGYTPLHYAVSKSNGVIVDWLLENGADVNIPAEDGETALHISARASDASNFDVHSNLRIAKALIEGGANIHAAYTSGKFEGYTPLHTTAMQCGIQVIPVFLWILLDLGADPNVAARDKQTPLHLAVLNSREELVVNKLLEHGANPNVLNADNKTPFRIAMEKRHAAIVKEFLKHCPNLNNKYHSDALRLALEDESFADAVIQALVQYGFSMENYPDVGDLFYKLVTQHQEDLLLKLLSQGFDPNKLYRLENGESFLPLHLAVSNYFIQVVRHLVSLGADLNEIDETGRSALSYVRINKIDDRYYSAHVCAEMIELLLEYGACLKGNPQLLCFAVANAFFELFELLLKHGADVNQKDERGFTVLQYAITCDSVPHRNLILRALLERGADVNARCQTGMGVLHYAALNDPDRYYVTKLLFENNADVNICFDGFTPLHLSAMTGNSEFIKLLLRNGANVNAKLKNGKTALHLAAAEYFCRGSFKQFKTMYKNVCKLRNPQEMNFDEAQSMSWNFCDARIIDNLLDRGAEVNVTDEEGKTALHYAAENERLQGVLVDLLIKRGADVISRDSFKRTALHYAKGDDNLVVLVVAGADINCKDVHGCTPLHLVAKRGLQGMFKLIQLGADINLVNNANVTPLEEGFNVERSFLHSKLRLKSNEGYEAVNERKQVLRKEVLSLRKHILKLSAASLYIHPKNLEIQGDFTNQELGDLCKLELVKMKDLKIGKPAISYYDIFTSSRNYLVKLSKNEELVQALDFTTFSEVFSCYADEFEMKWVHLKQASTRAHLLELCMEMFCVRVGNLPHLCSEFLLDYLSDDDLESLVRASNPNIVIHRKVSEPVKNQLITHLSLCGGEGNNNEDGESMDMPLDDVSLNSSVSSSDDDYPYFALLNEQSINQYVDDILVGFDRGPDWFIA